MTILQTNNKITDVDLPDRYRHMVNSFFLTYSFSPERLAADSIIGEDGLEYGEDNLVNECVNSIFIRLQEAMEDDDSLGGMPDELRAPLVDRLRKSCRAKYERDRARFGNKMPARDVPEAREPTDEELIAAERAAEHDGALIEKSVDLTPQATAQPPAQAAGAGSSRKLRKMLRRHAELSIKAMFDPTLRNELAELTLAITNQMAADAAASGTGKNGKA